MPHDCRTALLCASPFGLSSTMQKIRVFSSSTERPSESLLIVSILPSIDESEPLELAIDAGGALVAARAL